MRCLYALAIYVLVLMCVPVQAQMDMSINAGLDTQHYWRGRSLGWDSNLKKTSFAPAINAGYSSFYRSGMSLSIQGTWILTDRNIGDVYYSFYDFGNSMQDHVDINLGYMRPVNDEFIVSAGVVFNVYTDLDFMDDFSYIEFYVGGQYSVGLYGPGDLLLAVEGYQTVVAEFQKSRYVVLALDYRLPVGLDIGMALAGGTRVYDTVHSIDFEASYNLTFGAIIVTPHVLLGLPLHGNRDPVDDMEFVAGVSVVKRF
jgi:hypothetical protein